MPDSQADKLVAELIQALVNNAINNRLDQPLVAVVQSTAGIIGAPGVPAPDCLRAKIVNRLRGGAEGESFAFEKQSTTKASE